MTRQEASSEAASKAAIRDDLIVERVSALRAVDGDPDHVPLLFAPDNLGLAIRRQIILPSSQTHKNASAKKIPSPRVSDAFHFDNGLIVHSGVPPSASSACLETDDVSFGTT
jgi:hypothetical protein